MRVSVSESEVVQSCPTLHDPVDCSLPGSSIHGIFPGKSTGVECQAGSLYTAWTCWTKEWFMSHMGWNRTMWDFTMLLYNTVVTHLYLTLCEPMHYSPPGSSVYRIFQARILKWVAISFFRGFSQPRDWTWVSRIAAGFFTIWATREVPYKT